MTDPLFDSVLEEAARASERHGDFASAHEALGVLTEEYFELIEAIHSHDHKALALEAKQIAAVALRIMHAVETEQWSKNLGSQNLKLFA